jgi:hypothetical protein
MSDNASATADDPWAAYLTPPADAASADTAAQTDGSHMAVLGKDPKTGVTVIGMAPAGASAPAQAPEADEWAAYLTPPKDTPPAAAKSFSAGDAAASGAIDALTFGLAPAIAGATAAGKGAVSDDLKAALDADPTGQSAGAAQGVEFLAGLKKLFSGDKPAQSVYDATRQSVLEDQNNAAAQHPYFSAGGQVAGAIASLPLFGGAGGESLFARLLAAARAGAVGTGAYDAGSSVSAGNSAPQVIKNAAEGAGTGALFGLLGAGAMEGAGAFGSKVASIVRGTGDVNAEAARRVVNAIGVDYNRAGGFPLDPDAIAAAIQSGMPRAIVDTGGERTLALARSAANTSPEARAALNELAQDRFNEQAPRIAGFIRSINGNPDAAAETEALQSAARAANKPAYQRAYVAGDRGIWSPELERLASSPAVADAMRGAVQRGQNRAVADGFGAFNPKLTVTDDGRLIFHRGPSGVPTHPSLQFFDYTQRELRDAASAAQRAGRNEEAGALFGLHKQLLAELDRQVPAFAGARRGAAAFFGAQNALEAGRGFVMSNASLSDARRALAKMSQPERDLFQRGFASELADRIERTGDRRNVVNSIFLGNPAARQRIEMALGRPRGRQLEALLRAETLTDGLRRALGNSTTARQLAEMGMAGAGVAGIEWLKDGDVNPAHAIAGAVTMGLLHHGAKLIDERVSRRVGELLASSDTAQLAKGVQIVSRNHTLFNALRRLTSATARVGAHDLGFRRSVAVGAALTGIGAHEGDGQPAGDARDDRPFLQP